MNDGYLILGKKDSYLELPAFDFDVEKIEVIGHSGASASVKQNIYAEGVAVSEETTGANGVTNVYEISGSAQAAGTVYKLMVTSSHNTQMDAIKIYKKSSGGETVTVAKPAFSVNGGKCYEPFELSLSCSTEGASIYYTLDGTDPSSASTVYTSAITISETTTVKAVAVSGEQTSEIASATYTFPTAVANIAGLAGVASGEDVILTLADAQVLYVNGTNDVYIKDATGAMDFFKPGLTFTAGQILNGTIIASNSPYNGIYEIKPISGKTNLDNVTITDGEATPVVMTTAEASESSAYCQLVTIKDVVPVADGTKFYTDDTKAVQIYNKFGVDYSLDENKKYNITGIIITFSSGGNIVSELAPTVVPEEVETAEEVGFRDIKADLTQLQALATESNVYISVAEDGTISQTDDAETAAATLKGTWHGTSYGWSNFTASVPVEGTVKITYATHDYGNDITVTNAEGTEVAKLNTMGAKWSSNHDNVVSTYYRVNEPTTLHFSNANYNPYFAVEAIAPEDIPAEVTTHNVTFGAGDAEGVAPAAVEVEDGSAVKLPKNYTLYKEGSTLTGWSDGTETYAPGTEITPTADVALTPVFTENTVALADRESAVSIVYALDGYNDNPQHKFQGSSTGNGIMVTQATVNGAFIDVAVRVDATSSKFSANGSGWHQVNAGAKVTVPSCKGAVITVKTYKNENALKFGETAAEVNADPASYEATTDDETLVIEQTANGYWSNLSITLPAVGEEEENPFPLTEDVTATWDFGDGDVMAATMALSGTTTPGKVDDVAKDGIKMTVEANGATFRNNGGTNIQVRTGAVFKVPVQSTDDVVTVNGYPNYSFYAIGNNTTVLNDVNTYKAKLADVEQGYVAITSMNDNNYYYSISVDLKAPKEPVTLDNEPVTATFPFHEGTEKQTAEFGDDADYFLSSKVTHGSGLTITGKGTPKDLTTPVETLFQPTEKVNSATDDNAIQFIIIPKPGFTFTPSSVSITATRFGTNDGLLDFAWINPDNTTVSLATGQRPNRNDGQTKHDSDTNAKFTTFTYEITGAKAAEGQCGLKVNLYGLANTKQIGFSDIIINGTLSGTEREMPILASFKLNGTEYAADEVFEIDGSDYVGEVKLSKTATMVSAENPLTDITAASGEIGTVTYEGSETACTVTIPMTAGEESINYILNVVQKPDYTLSYIGLDGSTIGTQTVEEDAAIGEFAVDIASVEGAKEGYKARGWFKNNYVGEKYKTADVITSDISLYAIETEIEVASDSRKYSFNLADPFFYAEDHEAFTPTEGSKCKFHDTTHGWSFYDGDQVDLLVGPKATIYVTLCQYGKGTNVLVLDANGETLATLNGKSETDGELQTYAYEGPEGKISLKFVATGEMYIHNVKIVNTTTTNYDQAGQWITVKAGDASSFVDAIDAANGISGDERVYIFLPNGTYDLGQTCLTQIGRKNISIIGQSTEGTIIQNKPAKEGIAETATLLNTSENLYMQDLTLKNNWDYYGIAGDGRGVCLQDKGNNTVCKNVRMLSYQDTYYTNNAEGNFYWEDSEIHGTVDFICGEGTLFMENSKLFVEKRNADGTGECTITAPSTKDGKQYGYVFNNCTIENEAESFNFGRAWNNKPRAAYLNTTIINDKLISTRWRVAGMNNNNPVEFVEYKSVDESGSVISPESNVVTFTNAGGVTMETILTDAQAANFTLDKVFTGWTPAEFTVQVDAPDAEIAEDVITWTPADDAIAYALFKNDELMGITTEASFDAGAGNGAHGAPRKAEGDDVYTIRAANAHGGFGEAKTISVATGIEGVITEKDNVVSTHYYNVAGARVSDSAKGVLIKVEKLENGKTVTTKIVR
ncbi:MAG: pectinesterase family protein [Prevotella sp.]|nr:pectinesterase family protein [Prevotella sp.]